MSITTRKTTISNAQTEEVLQGIGMIDAGYRATVDNKDVQRGFRLDAETRTILVRLGIALKPIAEGFAKSRDAVFEEHDPLTTVDEAGKQTRHIPGHNIKAFTAERTRLAEVAHALDLPVLPLASLKLGQEKGENPIPSLAVTLLSPVLDVPTPTPAAQVAGDNDDNSSED